MEKTVCFRDFEERDIDFIYKCKNDEKLNNMIVGQWHPFTYEEASKWVHGCMGEHETFKFWAIATNDDERRIVGWAALSQIDKVNNSAFFHSIVIGDERYRNGFPWVETQLFVITYAFEQLQVNRLGYSCLSEHPSSMTIAPVMFFSQEGLLRDAVYKHERYYDEALFSLLKDEYYLHKKAGDYELDSTILRYASIARKNKKK